MLHDAKGFTDPFTVADAGLLWSLADTTGGVGLARCRGNRKRGCRDVSP
jgi:hypothetical protein